MKLFRGLTTQINKAYNRKINATGLAVFRVGFFSCLFMDVIHLFKYSSVVFDVMPYLERFEILLWPSLLLWSIALLFLIFGAFTRVAVIVNYIFCVVFISTISTFEYHMYYIYVSVSFVSMFLPLGAAYSVDRVIRVRDTLKHRKVSVLFYFLPVFTGIGLTYFDSVFHKYVTHIWQSGLGVWLPSSLPQMVIRDIGGILNVKWLMIFLSHLTLFLETIFIFTFWFRRFRVPLLIVGVGLHAGIALIFPIPWFGLGMISIYMLLVPAKFWRRVGRIMQKKERFEVEYSPSQMRLATTIKRLDWFNAVDLKKSPIPNSELFQALLKTFPGVLFQPILIRLMDIEQASDNTEGYALIGEKAINLRKTWTQKAFVFGFIFLSLAQFVCIYRAPLIRGMVSYFGNTVKPIDEYVTESFNAIRPKLAYFFGISSHPVFVDTHFEGYNQTLAIIYEGSEERMIPLTKENGICGSYQVGPLWAKWGFRANGPVVSMDRLEEGMLTFSALWLDEQNLDFDHQKFKLVLKENDVPTGWKENFLKEQLKKPWREIGTFHYEKGKMIIDYLDFSQIENGGKIYGGYCLGNERSTIND